MYVVDRSQKRSRKAVRHNISEPIIQELYWMNLEANATKGYFTDFTSTGPLDFHIKNVSKSTFGTLLKIVVLKYRVSHLHGNET